jgi:hypothetical protein
MVHLGVLGAGGQVHTAGSLLAAQSWLRELTHMLARAIAQ